MKSPLRLLPFVLLAFPLSAARALDIQRMDVTGMTPARPGLRRRLAPA